MKQDFEISHGQTAWDKDLILQGIRKSVRLEQ